MSKPQEFILGVNVTPLETRKDNGTRNGYVLNYSLTVGKEYEIIELTKCDGRCGINGCAGRPHIKDDSGQKISICGFGAPDTSFDVLPGEWET